MKKCCSLCCRVACITRNCFKTQNPRLINKSGLKSREIYNGSRKVHTYVLIPTVIQLDLYYLSAQLKELWQLLTDWPHTLWVLYHRKNRPREKKSPSSRVAMSQWNKIRIFNQKSEISKMPIINAIFLLDLCVFWGIYFITAIFWPQIAKQLQ